MKSIKIKKAEASVDSFGNVKLVITHMDDKKNEVHLGKIPFALDGKTVHDDLSQEDKEIVEQQIKDVCKKHLIDNNMKTEAQIAQEAEQFLDDIASGKRPPDFIGYR
jgi:hypothetical protein